MCAGLSGGRPLLCDTPFPQVLQGLTLCQPTKWLWVSRDCSHPQIRRMRWAHPIPCTFPGMIVWDFLLKCVPRMECRRGRGDICQQKAKVATHSISELTIILFGGGENHKQCAQCVCVYECMKWHYTNVWKRTLLLQTQGPSTFGLTVRPRNEKYSKQEKEGVGCKTEILPHRSILIKVRTEVFSSPSSTVIKGPRYSELGCCAHSD
jgi:hypothetical protein